jgi:acyl transferase domain-containing protein
VHFHQAISSILKNQPAPVFVEISPHPTLSSYITAVGVPSNNVTCPMRRPSKHASGNQLDVISFAETLGLLATLGINTIDLSTLYGRASRDPIYDIPYPFVTRHFPLRVDGPREPPAASGGICSLRLKASTKTFPDFADHIINGEPVLPASTYVDLVRLSMYCSFRRVL